MSAQAHHVMDAVSARWARAGLARFHQSFGYKLVTDRTATAMNDGQRSSIAVDHVSSYLERIGIAPLAGSERRKAVGYL